MNDSISVHNCVARQEVLICTSVYYVCIGGNKDTMVSIHLITPHKDTQPHSSRIC